MRLAIFGATGGTGRAMTEQALAAGHVVKALVRDPNKIAVDHPNLIVIQGDVLEPDRVQETVTDVDAVFVALGNTANNPDQVVSTGTQNIVAAMQESGVRRLIVISSLGVGDSKDQVPFVFKVLAKTVLRKAMQDKERQEAIVQAADLDWTIVRPGGLTDGPQTGSYRYGLDPDIRGGQVARADVAAFALSQLADPQFLHKTPAIT